MSLTTRLVSRICVASGLAKACLRQRQTGRLPGAIVLAYHRIGRPESDRIGLDSHILSASPEGFDRQMRYLCQHFTMLPLGEIVHQLRTGGQLPPNVAAITFDDGYRDNYDLAFPILQQHNLTATIFLATGYIGSSRRMWWDDLADVIQRSPSVEVQVSDLGTVQLKTARDRQRAMKTLRAYLKTVSDDEKERCLERLWRQLDMVRSRQSGFSPYLTWDNVRAMSRSGATFGAHTHSHPILTRVSPERACQEIMLSKLTIERKLGHPVKWFAYPNGLRGDFNASTRAMLIEAGFEAAFTLVHGSNSSSTDLYALRRIYIRGDDFTVFIAKVSGVLEMLDRIAGRLSNKRGNPQLSSL